MNEEKPRVASLKVTRVQKTRLLSRLHENFDQHKEEHAEAVAGYYDALGSEITKLHEKATKQFTLASKLAKEKDRTAPRSFGPFSTDLRMPVDHSDQFESVIARIEWEVADEVDLHPQEFNNFVLNKWDWTAEHITAVTSFAPQLLSRYSSCATVL